MRIVNDNNAMVMTMLDNKHNSLSIRKKGNFLYGEVTNRRPKCKAEVYKTDKVRVAKSENGSEGNCRSKSIFCLTASIWGKNGVTPVGGCR